MSKQKQKDSGESRLLSETNWAKPVFWVFLCSLVTGILSAWELVFGDTVLSWISAALPVSLLAVAGLIWLESWGRWKKENPAPAKAAAGTRRKKGKAPSRRKPAQR